MLGVIWYHSHNFKNIKNTLGGVLLSVKLQAITLLKGTLLQGCFLRFLNFANGNKSCKNTTYCNFHVRFMYHPLYFPLCTFTALFPCFVFLFINGSRKQTLLIKRLISVFLKVEPPVSVSCNGWKWRAIYFLLDNTPSVSRLSPFSLRSSLK